MKYGGGYNSTQLICFFGKKSNLVVGRISNLETLNKGKTVQDEERVAMFDSSTT